MTSVACPIVLRVDLQQLEVYYDDDADVYMKYYGVIKTKHSIRNLKLCCARLLL